MLPGSVHWRRNQRRLAYNRASKQRSWIRTKQRFWNRTKFKGKNGHWNARPGILDHLASYPHITPSRIDSLFEHHCPLGAVFHEIELARAIQELESDAAMSPEGGECGCEHEHCEHVVHRIPHPISENTLAEETIIDFLMDANVLNVPRSVARYYSRDVLESSLSLSFSSEDAERTVLRGNLMATHLKTYEMNGGASKPSFEDMPLIWDTGASSGLTPFKADFLTYEECDIPIKDVSQTNRVIGMGLAMYRMTASNGNEIIMVVPSYHLPHTDIRLLSPQAYHRLYRGNSYVDDDVVQMNLCPLDQQHRSRIDIPMEPNSNLPILFNVSTTSKEKELHRQYFKPRLSLHHREEGVSGSAEFSIDEGAIAEVEYEFNRHQSLFGKWGCVSAGNNQNLSAAQKELLLWHWKLGIGMKRVQSLMRERVMKDDNNNPGGDVLPQVIHPKLPNAASCAIPVCETCQLARQKQRTPKTKTSKAVKEKEGILSADYIRPGDCVHMDQYISKTPGRLESGYGKEGADDSYHGGTIFTDSASSFIWVENQVTLGVGDTLAAKQRVEEFLWEEAAVRVKRYHSDNGIFNAEEFESDCHTKEQAQDFSGVGAQHQNAKAERAIQTVMWMARSYMLHAGLRWYDEGGVDDVGLWSFAVKHAAWIHNRLPDRSTGLTPLEVLTGTKNYDSVDLARTHVWGCPAFVLDPALQNGKKIPKWNRRSRMGQFLGFSPQHSSLVALIRHLSTGYVSPQYHVVFDDRFETVFGNGRHENVEHILDGIFENSRDMYAEPEIVDGEVVYKPPPLHKVWLTDADRVDHQQERLDQRRRRDKMERDREKESARRLKSLKDEDDLPSLAASDDGSCASSNSEPFSEAEGGGSCADHPSEPSSAHEGAKSAHEGAKRRSKRIADRQRKGLTIRRGFNLFANMSREERNNLSHQQRGQYAVSLGTLDEPAAVRTANVNAKFKPRTKAQIDNRANNMLRNMTMDHTVQKQHGSRLHENDFDASAKEMTSVEDILASPLAKFIHLSANHCGYEGTVTELVTNWVHPLFLKAKAEASKLDNPNWNQAMNGEFAPEFWDACKVEINTLEGMGAWKVVKKTAEMNVLRSTWAFKIKRYPDGLIKKFKARFCARGDMQIEGVDFFETYAPVVQWTTVRLMLILEVLLDLKSKQGDVTAAFLHSDLEEGENVYVEMPTGFRKEGHVLSLKKTLYGLRQSPRAFWKYLVKKMESVGLHQSEFDPCLFIGETVIAVAFVDDILFWSVDEKDIHEKALALRNQGVLLEEEEDAAGFLGVDIQKNEDGLTELKQEGLINRIVEALGLQDSAVKYTPAEGTPLVRDTDGEPFPQTFNYASVIGMLLYLAGHSRPDIAYAVNMAARYMFSPRSIHEKAVKRIGRYLKATRSRGIVLCPSDNVLKIDAYPDADFAGMWGHEENTDPSSVKSRTGFVINVADCPVLWVSKLQNGCTAQSTMEAEIIALNHCCRELFPLMDMVTSLSTAVGLPQPMTTMRVCVHEDNAGALVLANTLPPQYTPRSKFYAIKTIWMREEFVKRKDILTVMKIDTVEQLGDIFTKGLPKVTFEYLRNKLMGW